MISHMTSVTTRNAPRALGAALALAVMAVASPPARAADTVPTFDTRPSCKSAAAASIMTGRNTDNCLSDENNARDILKKSWREFSAADKSHCVSLERTGGSASYVELLSCLEMSRDARVIARDRAKNPNGSSNETPSTTTGSGSPQRRPTPSGAQP